MPFIRKHAAAFVIAAFFAGTGALMTACLGSLRTMSRHVEGLAKDVERFQGELAALRQRAASLGGRADEVLRATQEAAESEADIEVDALRRAFDDLGRRAEVLQENQQALQARIRETPSDILSRSGRPAWASTRDFGPGADPAAGGIGTSATAEALTAALQGNDRETLRSVVEEVLEDQRLGTMWSSLWATKAVYESMLRTQLSLTEPQRNSIAPIMTEHTQDMYGLLSNLGQADGDLRRNLEGRVRDRWRVTEDRIVAYLAPEQVDVFEDVRWYH